MIKRNSIGMIQHALWNFTERLQQQVAAWGYLRLAVWIMGKSRSPTESVEEIIDRELLAALPERKQKIIRLRFGLDGNGPRTLEQVGRKLGISRQAVQQQEQVVIRQLRKMLREGVNCK